MKKPREKEKPRAVAYRPVAGYEFNPMRAFPRNQCCPCGSGKKFKACCLNEMPLYLPHDTAAEVRRRMAAYEQKQKEPIQCQEI